MPMRHVQQDAGSETSPLSLGRSAALLGGIAVLAVSVSILTGNPDPRSLSANALAGVSTVAAWAHQVRMGESRWWRTALLGGVLGGGVLGGLLAAEVHVAAGGSPDVWANVYASFAGEAFGLVLLGLVPGLHLVGRGLGWNRRQQRDA